MISFCLLADRVCVVPSVVWLVKFPTGSNAHDCDRKAVPVMAVLPAFSVPRANVLSWFSPS